MLKMRKCVKEAFSLWNLKDRDIPAPFNRPLDAFLAGGPNRKVDVDKIFARSLNEVTDNYDLGKMWIDRETHSILEVGYKIRTVDAGGDSGVILLSPSNEIVGAYLGCLLSIVEEHQGRSLGAELVFDLAYDFGALPTWYLDTASYSPVGLSSHRRAWFFAHNREFLEAKGIHVKKKLRPSSAAEAR